MFTTSELTRHGVGNDGLRRWTTPLPGYTGRILTPPDWTHTQVADRLNTWSAKTSAEIVAARLWTPCEIHHHHPRSRPDLAGR